MLGLSFSLTGIWLGMRSVMDIGGSCASGGPVEVVTPCPGGVEVLLTLGFPIGFASAGLMIWKGSRLGAGYAGLVALAWPALFLSLGWNFLEYGVRNPFGEGVELGWLIPGVIFVIMGAVPLLGWLAARGHGPVVPGVRSTTTPMEIGQLAAALRQVSLRASRQSTPTMTIAQSASARDRSPEASAGGVGTDVRPGRQGGTGPSVRPAGQGGMVAQLERLAVLRDSGALTTAEYEDAKMAVIRAASRGEVA